MVMPLYYQVKIEVTRGEVKRSNVHQNAKYVKINNDIIDGDTLLFSQRFEVTFIV